MMRYFVLYFAAACGSPSHVSVDAPGTTHESDSSVSFDSAPQSFLVYAHSDTTLYTIDLVSQSLVTIGSFQTSDVITDLAVAPNGVIYVNGEQSLFTADPNDGHVTRVGSLATCGTRGVALTTTSDGRLWIGDYLGAICEIDISGPSPVVKAPVMMSDGFALAGDMVGIGDGTVFGTAYKLNDTTSERNNVLVKVDVHTGQVTQVGPSGYPRLYGAAFQEDKVFAFTHDGSGRVVTIDTNTGAGSMFGTFMDAGAGIAFAGAGVNSLVQLE